MNEAIIDKNELLSKLEALRDVARQIVDAQKKQARIVNSYRQNIAEQSHLDFSGGKAKAKLSIMVVIAAYFAMKLLVTLFYTRNWGGLAVLACVSVFLYVIKEKQSKVMRIIKVAIYIYLFIDAADFLSIAVKDLKRGVVMTYVIILLALVAGAGVIVGWIVWNNKKIDQGNEKIREQNRSIAEKNGKLKAEDIKLSESIRSLQTMFRERAADWYPAEHSLFGSLYGIELVIQELRSNLSDTLKEALQRVTTSERENKAQETREAILRACEQHCINDEKIIQELGHQNATLDLGVSIQAYTAAQVTSINRGVQSQNRKLDRLNQTVRDGNESASRDRGRIESLIRWGK